MVLKAKVFYCKKTLDRSNDYISKCLLKMDYTLYVSCNKIKNTCIGLVVRHVDK